MLFQTRAVFSRRTEQQSQDLTPRWCQSLPKVDYLDYLPWGGAGAWMKVLMGLTFGPTSPQGCATSFPQPAHSPMGFGAEVGSRKTNQNLGNQTKGDAGAGWLGIWDGGDALALLCRVGGSEGSPSRRVRAWCWLWIPSWSTRMGLIPWGCCNSLLLCGTGQVRGHKSASDLHDWQKGPVH